MSMLDFRWKCIEYKLNKIQGISQKIMLAPFFFTNIFGHYANKEGYYIRNYMLDFPLFMALTSEYYHLSMKDK